MPELSIYQEAAIATVAVLVVTLLVQRRRRAGHAAAAAGTTSAGPAGTPASGTPASGAPSAGSFRFRRKGDAPDGAPRGRRRRRLAQEAVAATGAVPVELPASEEEAIAPVAPVEPFVPAAPVVEPAPAEQPTGEIPIVTIDQAIEPASEENGHDFVAQPGWPAPGELATGYDPDAFDPVPEPGSEVEQAEADSEADQPEPVEDDHPGADDEILILPDDDPVEEPQVTVDVESLEWDAMDDGGFDPATGWGADEPEAPAWEEGDDEPTAWSFEAESEAGPSFEAEPEAVEAVEPVDEHEAEHEAPEVDWEDVPSPWAAPVEDVVEEAPEDPAPPVGLLDYELPPLVAEAAPNEPAATAHPVGPLVLDLGSIGRAGEAIELVIEPGRPGEGIRLRLSSRDEVEAVHEPQSDGTPLSTRERQAFDELDELLQGMLRLPEADTLDEPEAAAEPAFDAEPEAQVEPKILDVPFLTGGPVAFAAPAEADVEEPFEPYGDGPQNGHHDDANGHHANGHDAVEADDPHDPAAILAEIRARLALLDAPRAERESDGAPAGLS
jgi:hypothetical protein